MANPKVNAFLSRIGQNFTENWHEIRDLQNWMLEEIYRKRVQFPYWKKKVLFSWVSYNKKQTNKDHPSRFFSRKIDTLFRHYFQNMYPFEETQLELVGIDGNVSNEHDIFFEYKYWLSKDEIEEFIQFKQDFKHPEHYHRIISYIFNIIIMVFGKLIQKILKTKFQIVLLCAEVKHISEEKEFLHFLVSVRKNDYEFLKAYLRTMIFHFAERIPSVDQIFLERLRLQKNRIFNISLQKYPDSESLLTSSLFTLQRKCQVLEQITPMLDIQNYICSRVEDSLYDLKTLVNEIILNQITSDPQLANDILDLFSFFNQNASLFSTFQSNNRANIQRQYQLFFFYSQYFCVGGLEMMKNNPAFFFLDILNMKIDQEMDKTKFPEQMFSNFLLQGTSLLDNQALDVVFQKIFQKDIYEINEEFFESFLLSLNLKFEALIHEKQTKNPNFCFSFADIIHLFEVILYNLVMKIFIAKTPQEALVNFSPMMRMGRYTPERLALRVSELIIFKDIPLSDNNWEDYYLSRNRNYIKKVFQPYYDIPDSYFFSPERLLKINMIYERGFLETTPHLEQWIIQENIKAFKNFYDEIRRELPVEYSEKDVLTSIVRTLTKGVIDSHTREQLEDVAEFFIDIWE